MIKCNLNFQLNRFIFTVAWRSMFYAPFCEFKALFNATFLCVTFEVRADEYSDMSVAVKKNICVSGSFRQSCS